MRWLIISLFASLAISLSSMTATAQGRIMITSYTNDFEFASGNVGCPKGPWGSAFVADINRLGDKMNIRDYEEMFRLIDRYERRHGIQIRSKTRVENFEVIEDRIRTEATGPVDEVGSLLCELISASL